MTGWELADAVATEARSLQDEGARRAIVLRLIGSLAIRLRCVEYAPLLPALGRRPYRDIDFMAYSRQEKQVEQIFEERGYALSPEIKAAREFGVKRLIYEHPKTSIKADVFLDDLVMAHTVPLRGRLELGETCLSAVDLLLSKLQIHEITENDLMDTIVLLAEHELGSGDGGVIDVSHLVELLRSDWGFCHSTLTNLEKVEAALDRYDALPAEVAAVVRRRVSELRERIENEPKSARWKLRARVGTRMRWYEEVGDVKR